MEKDLGKDNGRLLVLVLKRSGILSVKIVCKENGTIWRKRWCWNLQKADTQSSEPRVHCPEVGSKARAMENCRYTIVPIWKRLRLFFAQSFLSISSVFTEQSQKCVKSTKPFTIERGNPLWEGNRGRHSCQAWSRQKFLWIVMTLLAKIFYCNSMENELESYHNKTNWANFSMDAGFLNVVEIGQYFMTKDTEEFSQFTNTVACREYTLPRDEEASQPKGWIQGNTKIGPALEIPTWCSGFCLWTETILTPGSEFLMDQISLWWIWTTTSRKFQKFSSKNVRGNWMQRILQADQRPKQNHKEENLPALHQEQFILGKERGPILNQGNIRSPIMKYRRNWFIFFVMEIKCIEKMMERFNSGEWKRIFRNISRNVLIGLTTSGRRAWQEEEETRRDTSTALILQEKSCISVLFKVLQDAIILILLYRAMLLFRTTSSSTFIMSDVQSIYIPSSIRDRYLEVKIWTTDRQYSFCMWIPWANINRILTRSTWMHRVMHNTWRHQNAVYWVDINLALRKGLKFYQTRSNAIILHETLPAYCIPKVV